MTPRERIRAAMNLEVPDRTTLMCQMSIGHMLIQLGASPVEFWLDPEVFAEGLVRLRSIYDLDGILVSLHGQDPSWRNRIMSREMTEEGEVVRFTDGHAMIYPPDELPRPLAHSSPDNSNRSTNRDLPGALDYIPVSQGLHSFIHPDHRFDIFRAVREKAGAEISLHGEVTSPFDYFLDFFGYQDGLMKLVDDSEGSKKTLFHFANLVAQLASEMCEYDIDAVKISSPFAGAGFISRDFYREFVLPSETVVVKAVQDHGIHVYMHTCGAIGDRLDLMFESGITGIECLDPPPLGTVELAEAKNRIGRKGFIKGNIDSVNTLLMKTEEDILKDAEERIRTGKEGGGFILSTACSVAPHVPREHLLVLRKAVDQWG